MTRPANDESDSRLKAHVPDLLTPAETAAILRLSVSAVYALCDAGELPCLRIGAKRGRIRIERSDLEAYLAGTKAKAAVVKLPRAKMQRPPRGYDILREFGYSG